jgi:hypothetical protein
MSDHWLRNCTGYVTGIRPSRVRLWSHTLPVRIPHQRLIPHPGAVPREIRRRMTSLCAKAKALA